MNRWTIGGYILLTLLGVVLCTISTFTFSPVFALLAVFNAACMGFGLVAWSEL